MMKRIFYCLKERIKFFLLAFIFPFLVSFSSAQSNSGTLNAMGKTLSIYLYQFAKNASTAHDSNQILYKIYIFGNDSLANEVTKSMKQSYDGIKIKNKTITVIQITDVANIENADLLFVNQNNESLCDQIVKQTIAYPTLICGFGFKECNPMINIVSRNKKISYDIYKVPCDSKQIALGPEIIDLAATVYK